MTRGALLRRLDQPAIEAAIAEAEARTTGEIRISVAGLFWGSSATLAERAFARLGMQATRDRNGVLLLILPWRRQLILRADVGIAERVAPAFWEAVVGRTTPLFREHRFTEALLQAVGEVGAVLAEHFPAGPQANPDELPNRID